MSTNSELFESLSEIAKKGSEVVEHVSGNGYIRLVLEGEDLAHCLYPKLLTWESHACIKYALEIDIERRFKNILIHHENHLSSFEPPLRHYVATLKRLRENKTNDYILSSRSKIGLEMSVGLCNHWLALEEINVVDESVLF